MLMYLSAGVAVSAVFTALVPRVSHAYVEREIVVTRDCVRTPGHPVGVMSWVRLPQVRCVVVYELVKRYVSDVVGAVHDIRLSADLDPLGRTLRRGGPVVRTLIC